MRVEEVRHQRGGTGRGEPFGFVGNDFGVLPGQCPGGQSLKDRWQGADPPGLFHEGPGGPGADGQDPRDFLYR
ncbi:hypothetical protein [Arthrobacter sp. SLBN-122]|uniref:hypothetical protein n=1 Tax=Arthrobacter sp. SLBN-122 TaxID=2768455 RepID=UPI003FA48B4B